MRIIVIGTGKIGAAILERLAADDHDLVAVDRNEKKLQVLQNNMDVLCICGNGILSEVLTQAGVQTADLVIAVTADDEKNLLCCLIARKLGAKRTIARVRNPEYYRQLSLFGEELGLSLAINPEEAAAQEIFSVLRFPGVTSVEDFAHGRLELAELKLADESILTSVPLAELGKSHDVRALVCAVRRGRETIIPDGTFQLRKGDVISFLAEPLAADHFLKLIGIRERMPKNVMLVGGGRLTVYLLELLQGVQMRPVVIEENPERAQELSDAFAGTLVIQGDGTEKRLLLEEGIDKMDAFAAVTGTDEVNSLLAMYATSRGVSKVVTKISRIEPDELLITEDIGSRIFPKRLVADRVLSYVRALDTAEGSGSIRTVYRIVDGTVEALEFIAPMQNSALLNIPFKDLRIRRNILIGAILRQGRVIIPGGMDRILPGDHVIVVALASENLSSLEGIL